jgi:hypothetical protein
MPYDGVVGHTFGLTVAARRLADQQLGDVGGDAPGLVAGEKMPGLVLEVDVGQRLAGGIAFNKQSWPSFVSGLSTDQGSGKRCSGMSAPPIYCIGGARPGFWPHAVGACRALLVVGVLNQHRGARMSGHRSHRKGARTERSIVASRRGL